MPNDTFLAGDLKCSCFPASGSPVTTYMIYPDVDNILPQSWLSDMSRKYDVSVVMIRVPLDEWNNYLTPWPEPGEAKGCQPFAGKAADFLDTLRNKIIPIAEKMPGMTVATRRDLMGVSLSGLFTLWQWMQCDLFDSIASLSGSFWYNGFMEWFEARPVPTKGGKAYFLLGIKEPKAKTIAYQSVGSNTEAIEKRLSEAGIDTRFDWVPGTHISDPLPRATKAFNFLYNDRL